jgi:uncharacterized protein
MRWFYRAYVNRLGVHLIELYSGRLAIGADQYRRLTRKTAKVVQEAEADVQAPVVAVAGARNAGQPQLIEALDRARLGTLEPVRARLGSAGLDETLADKLKDLQWLEVPPYKAAPGAETARERSTRREAVEEAVESDLLLLVIDANRDDTSEDVAFLRDWAEWYKTHPGLEVPPALVVLSGAERVAGDGEDVPGSVPLGRGAREAAVRARVEALKAVLPPTVTEVVVVGAEGEPSSGVAERLLPALASLLHRAERVALMRHFYRISTRSKARRLVSQVGRQGRRLWEHLKTARNGPKKAG